MKISQLLSQLQSEYPDLELRLEIKKDFEITGITFDSRAVKPGYVYCDLSNAKFLKDAVNSGAQAVLTSVGGLDLGVGELVVRKDCLRSVAVSTLNIFYCNPSDSLYTIAVTGTNGKTTMCHLVREAMNLLGKLCSSCGTLGFLGQKRNWSTINTTPNVDLSQQWLSQEVKDGAEVVIFEASSHGIDQNRLEGIKFDSFAFTNLSHDHLDYHGTFENYARCKMSLLHALPASSSAWIPYQKECLGLAQGAVCNWRTWSVHDSAADAFAKVKVLEDGILLEGHYQETTFSIKSSLLGEHNGQNLFLAALILYDAGIATEDISWALSQVGSAAGRLQEVPVPVGRVFVDYAHTPDALEKILIAARKTWPSARLKIVFGAGGDRDKTKRPLMGKVVSELSDWCMVTSDNPRWENPELILDDIESGFPEQGFQWEREIDRYKAIRKAVKQLRDNDVLLVAGKGHELYQETEGVKKDFDDVEVISEVKQCQG